MLTVVRVLVLVLAVLVPLFVAPYVLENMYSQPKWVILFVLTWTAAVCLGERLWSTGRDVVLAVMALVVVMFLTTLWTANLRTTQEALLQNTTCLVLLLVVGAGVNRTWALRILHVSVVVGVVVAGLAILEAFEIFSVLPGRHRGAMVVSTIGNSNYLGAYLMFPFLWAVGFAIMDDSAPYWAAAAVIGAGLYLCQARAAWIGAAVGLLTLVLLFRWRAKQ
jgi:hypothetical protein